MSQEAKGMRQGDTWNKMPVHRSTHTHTYTCARKHTYICNSKTLIHITVCRWPTNGNWSFLEENVVKAAPNLGHRMIYISSPSTVIQPSQTSWLHRCPTWNYFGQTWEEFGITFCHNVCSVSGLNKGVSHSPHIGAQDSLPMRQPSVSHLLHMGATRHLGQLTNGTTFSFTLATYGCH